jgi:hypothetical protein
VLESSYETGSSARSAPGSSLKLTLPANIGFLMYTKNCKVSGTKLKNQRASNLVHFKFFNVLKNCSRIQEASQNRAANGFSIIWKTFYSRASLFPSQPSAGEFCSDERDKIDG